MEWEEGLGEGLGWFNWEKWREVNRKGKGVTRSIIQMMLKETTVKHVILFTHKTHIKMRLE